MSTVPDPLQNIQLGQFEDATLSMDQAPVDPRAGGHFIDDEKLLAWSDPENSADEDDDGIEEEYDDNRAEDEDWEVAEGGMSWSCLLKVAVNLLYRFHKAIQSSPPTCRSAQRKRTRRN